MIVSSAVDRLSNAGAGRAVRKALGRNRSARRVTWYLLCLAGLSVSLAGCNEEAPSPPEIRPVRTIVVDPHPIDDDRQAVGEVRPRHESDLGFRVAGKVFSRAVDVGASVKTGDLLARLDEQDFANRLKSAEAEMAAADAALTEAKASEERQRTLLEKGFATRATYDTALQKFNTARAQLDSAQATRDLAADQLRYTELHSEFDGIITAVGAEPGQVVSAGQMVVRLANPDERDAVFAIAEAAFKDRSKDERPEIFVSLLSSPDSTAEGVVREISPVADPATRTFQVRVTLKNPPAEMRFGSSVLGRLKGETAPVVVLPGTALFDKSGKPAVWVVSPSTATVALKPVIVSRYETDRVVIGSGVEKGEIVVTAGVNRLREGQHVRLVEGALP